MEVLILMVNNIKEFKYNINFMYQICVHKEFVAIMSNEFYKDHTGIIDIFLQF